MAPRGPPFRVARAQAGTLPGWELLALASALAIVVVRAGPVSDADVFWHIMAGRYSLAGQGFPHPDPWAFTLPSAHWHSTAWLSELVLALVYQLGGFAGIVSLRLALTVGLTWMLHGLLVKGRAGWSGPVVFAVTLLPLGTYLQERPQTVSLLFLVWLAGVCHRQLTEGTLPRPWLVVLVTYVWACAHGLFVLAPASLALLAVAGMAERGRADWPAARRLLQLATVTSAACALTPMGPRLLLSPLIVGRAARFTTTEWRPTNLLYVGTWGFALLMLLAFIAIARGGERVPRSEVLWIAAVSVFGFLAIRNAGPASLLLAPVVAARLRVVWDRTDSALRLPGAVRPAFFALAVLTTLLSYLQAPVLPDNSPRRIAATLARQPGQLRVFNDYNLSGYLILQASPHILLTVDGRADRYGAAYLRTYSEAHTGTGNWRRFVDSLHADVAVFGKDDAITSLLVNELHWTLALEDGEWVLLTAPTTQKL